MITFRKGSQVWKNIGRIFPFLERNTSWHVGDGKSIIVWQDEANLRVVDIICQNMWKMQNISFHLPKFIEECIFSYQIPSPSPERTDQSECGCLLCGY